jgi:hypothetical protein
MVRLDVSCIFVIQPGDAPRDSLDAFSEEEIALQLTLIDFNLYSAIKPVELLNQAWNKASINRCKLYIE